VKSLVYVEIDAPYCSLTYGTSPCTAAVGTTGDRKCFNTKATCQDRTNFDEDPVTMRFAKPAHYRPADIEVVAASLVSVDVTPGRISLGEDLGQRATLTAVFKDHPWSDTGAGGDKYLADRTYDPYRQGSFWGKFRARQKFLIGAPLRYIRGELGQTLAEMETRHYFVESISGPDTDGTFRVIAKDLLKFADNDRALAPAPNSGHLLSSITATDTSATLSPSGIGALEYPATGYAAIGGNEVVQFFRDTAVGNDANTKLLLHFDGTDGSTTITDSSSSARTATVVADAQLDDSQKKFGTTSLLLDGTGDYVTFPDSADWTFLGDFTIDCWIRATSLSADADIVSHSTDINNLWRLRVTSGGALQFTVRSGGSNIISLGSSSGLISTGGSFRHIAIVHNGTGWALYLDGSSVATTTDSDAIPNFTGTLQIGAANAINLFAGRIDELRISNVARWTAGFTVPTQPYLASADELYLVRGQRDTDAIAHDADDAVQVGLEYVADSAADIIRDLLVNYAAVDAAYVPLANWQAEITTYLGVLHTRRIFVPTGVRELVSELIREAALAMWWDDLTPQLRLMVLRAVPTSAGSFSPSNIMVGSFSSREQPEKRLSEVQVIYGLRNPLLPLDQPDSYRSREIVIDPGAEADYGSPAILQIFARWIPAFGSSIARELGERVLSRYRDPPRQFSLSVLRNGQDQIDLGDSYHLEWWTLQDDTGALADVPVQAIEVSSLPDRFVGVLEEVISDPDDAAAELDRVITIDSDVDNLDLLETYETIYPAPTTGDVTDGVTVRFVIYEGVTVGSTSRTVPALSTGVWPAGLVPTLEVNGRIQGAGGAGGAVSNVSGNGKPGLSGGTALKVEDVIVLEGTGEIWGGGGGGGSGALAEGGGSGGGGAGAVPGAAGALGGTGSVAGAAGTETAGGAGGVLGVGVDGGNGGAGGAPGVAGTAGANEGSDTGGAGGAAGKSVDGWSDVTDSSTIDFQGPQTG